VSSGSTKLLLLFLFIANISYGQKQVIFLKHGNVMARFTEGDRFTFKLKNHSLREGYITELNDFSMVTSALDTIPFLSIEKISVKGQHQKSFTKNVGRALVVGGLGYIVIDQLNTLVGSTASGFDESDKRALGIATVGAGLLFIKQRYVKVSRGVTIRTIDYHSPYYKFDR
jgi:hypothetical protein